MLGNMFRYKLFDRDGKARFVSDQQNWGKTDASQLADHNPAALGVLKTGQPYIDARKGDGVTRPRIYAEAYVPLVRDGRPIGILEIYIDHTALATRLRGELFWSMLKVCGLTGLGFLIPMMAYLGQSRINEESGRRIAHLARHDDLTGMMNRNAFSHLVAEMIADGRPFALHYVDLDRFKDVNDTLGHGVGDALLREVSTRLTDVVFDIGHVGRLGGDEFAVVHRMPDSSGNEHERIGQMIVRKLSRSFALGEHYVQIGASVGTALSYRDGKEVEALLRAADVALYCAKESGRGVALTYDPVMEEGRKARLALERRIREAVAQSDFELHYQPLYLNDGVTLSGFEALLRMRDAEGNPVSPAIFIPIAEELNLIDAIGRWVLREGCTQAALWPDHLKIAINLSPAQFESGELVATVISTLSRAQLLAHRLELEVTESLLMQDSEAIIDQLHALKQLGLSIALDDFGTGYSSLSYLWRFPFDMLKVDRSFMTDLTDKSSKSREILNTIVALGRVLNLEITAEGVETEAQSAVLRDMNFDIVQGFLLGRPAPVQDLAGIILRSAMQTSQRSVALAQDSWQVVRVSRGPAEKMRNLA
jgi:diguanylate cyclase (GGDEF)-like protein